MCRGTCWSQSEACQRCVHPSRRPPCSSWDNFEVAITVKLSSTSLPVMAKELRKNSIVERPFPTGFGWTSAFVALYPNFESLLEKGSSEIDLRNAFEGWIYLNTVSASCLELERTRHRDWTRLFPKIVETKMIAVDPEQHLIPFIYYFFHLVLLSPSTQAMLVVSFPNSTAIKAAKAQRSARDLPESLRNSNLQIHFANG